MSVLISVFLCMVKLLFCAGQTGFHVVVFKLSCSLPLVVLTKTKRKFLHKREHNNYSAASG